MVNVVQSVETEQRDESSRLLLEIIDLSFGYTGHPLLCGVQAYIKEGEMVGLLGPNGSGKTTLLRLMSGLLVPQEGKILLEGRELAKWGRRGLAQIVAVVPQELQVPFAFTVEQMVALGRTPFINLFGSRSRRDYEIVQEAMQIAEVNNLAARVFNELSGGERQRVMLAMALAQRPRLLLLDEPTSHLDIKYQIEMLELVKRLNRETGVTVIAAMHDLNLAARYFSRLLLFQRGIVADGGPAVVLEPNLLQRVYDVKVQVGVMHGTEYLSVLPPGEAISDARIGPRSSRVHVMAGGGTGALIMRALADAQIAFSTGALNIGDSDHALALRLASEVVTEQPFAPISPVVCQQLKEYLQTSSLLIICPMPIGPGNLVLLQEALEALQRGLPVFLLLPPDQTNVALEAAPSLDMFVQFLNMHARDYAQGEGVRLMRELLEAGAVVVTSAREVIEQARRLIR